MKSSGSHEAMHKRLGSHSWVMVRERLRRKLAFHFTNDSMSLNRTLPQFRDAIPSVKPSHWIVYQLSYQGSPVWERVHKKILKFSTGKGLELMFRASAPWKYMTRRERGGGVSGEIASKKTEQSTAGSCKWWRAQSWNSARVVARDSYYAVTFHDQSTDAPLSHVLLPAPQPDYTTLFQSLAECQLLIKLMSEKGAGIPVVE